MNEASIQTTDTPEEVQRLEGMVESLFLLFRTATSHGAGHPLLKQVCEVVCEKIEAVGPPFAIQFVGGVVFHNRNLVPVTPKVYPMSVAMAKALAHAAVQELTFHVRPTPSDVLAFAAEIVRSNRPRGQLPVLELRSMEWRTIEGAVHGAELEQVDPEVFAASQLALAVSEVEMIMMGTSETWDFPRGVSAIRRIERCVGAGPLPIARALEIAPGTWTTARRAVAACIHLIGTAKLLDVSAKSYRAAAHTLLACACMGYQPREGLAFDQAVRAAHKYLVEAPGDSRSQAEPHRVRTCGLLNSLLHQQSASESEPTTNLLGFIEFCYDLERMRCPADLTYELSLTDVLATLGPAAMRNGLGLQYKAMVTAYGQIPPGSKVVLEDGRVGMVLEASEQNPLLPVVLVEGKIEQTLRPVILVSPALLHPAEQSAGEFY